MLYNLENNRKHTCAVQTRSFAEPETAEPAAIKGNSIKRLTGMYGPGMPLTYSLFSALILFFLNVVSSGSQQLLRSRLLLMSFMNLITYPKSVKTQNQQANGTQT